MSASPTLDFWTPHTLTDSRNDITTVESQPTGAGLSPRELVNTESREIEVIVRSGFKKRRMILTIPAPRPAWLDPTLDRAASLLLLPFNWDRAGAPPVEPSAIQHALDALSLFMADRSSLPHWTPTVTGGVQLDWHERGIDLEIAFEPNDSEGCAVFSDHGNPSADWDGPVGPNLTRLRKLFSELLVRE